MKRVSRLELWLKAQRKYRNLQQRISSTHDAKLIKKLVEKLDRCKRRLLAMNRKWSLGIATSILMAWLAAPATVHAQEIELDNLSATDGFTIVGIAAGDRLGESVSMLGDLNDDGFNDFGVSASDANSIGQIYVIFGGEPSYPATLDPATLSTSGGLIINGISMNSETGESIAPAGDLNGDGIDDLLIGAPGANGDTGGAYVVFGDASLSGTLELSMLDGSNGFTINGIDADDYTGSVVSPAGDINSDGFDDIMISAENGDPDGLYNAGEVYIIYGKNTAATTPFAATLDPSTLDGTNGFIIESGTAEDALGQSIASAGDVNDDGINDILVGAPTEASTDFGKSYLVFGDASGFSSPFEISAFSGNDGSIINGLTENSYTGFVNGIGDVNGDGIDDFIVGAAAASTTNGTYTGQLYVIFGDDYLGSTIDLSDLGGSDGFVINGIDPGDQLAFAAPAGDFNGDGRNDFILAASAAEQGGGEYAGEVYIVFGKRSFPSTFDLSSLDEYSGIIMRGLDADDATGSSISGGNDINNDGYDDIIIGAYGGDTNGSESGEAYVILGRETPSLPETLTLGDLSALSSYSYGFVINGINADDEIGFSTAIVPDINGDGIDDIAIGAPNAGTEEVPSGDTSGQVYMIFGENTYSNDAIDLSSLATNRGFIINGASDLDQIGGDIDGVGDINHDGLNDFIIGNYAREDDGVVDRMFVVFGSNSGFPNPLNLADLDGTDGFQLTSLDKGAGQSVDAAGDVNGDGIDDFVIGAPYATPNGDESGTAYVLFGKNTSVDGNFSATLDLDALSGADGFEIVGSAAYSKLGQSVSSANVNGDGFSDLIIGANGVNDGAGHTYVIFGSMTITGPIDPSTLDGTNGFLIAGTEQYDSFGQAIDNAGDVNGDGIDDLIIGAPYASRGGKEETGESYVVFGKTEAFDAAINVSSLDGTNGFALRVDEVESYTGVSVSTAGDFNADGVDDILIGTYNTPDGDTYLVYGKDTENDGDFPALISLTQMEVVEGWSIPGLIDGDDVANFLGGGGDINNDGFDDIIIGYSAATANGNDYAGQAFVVYGGVQPAVAAAPAPEFVSSNTASFPENGTGTVLDVDANDGDGGATDFGITYTISGGADQAAFEISALGLLTFKSVPDFENPSDANADNEYELEVTADTGDEISTQAITITVTDVDESPIFVSANTASLAENATGTVLDVDANDGDGGASDTGITYTISGGADEAAFDISTEGLLTFASSPDFENPTDDDADNAYELEVTADDGAETVVQSITVTVTNVDESPVFVSANTASFAENGSGTVLDVDANDGDGGASDTGITYTLSGPDEAVFDISTEGLLTFVSSPDFENPTDDNADNIYELEVTANDGAETVVQSITVTVTNVDESPVFVSANTASFAENGSGTVLDVDANDGDGGASDTGITYTISGGADQAAFDISTEGLITFVSSPDFENPADDNADNIYELEVTANDGAETVVQSITVTVTNVDESPVFVSANTASFAENGSGTLLDVDANDGDGGASDTGITYTISGGVDQAAFDISIEGLITFVSPPDFENPADDNADNVYELEVTADDGNETTAQSISVTVTNVDENQAPTISDQTFNIDENSPNSTVVGTLVASDPDGDALIFSSDMDSNDPFALSAAGEVTVENVALLDFESVEEWSFTVEVSDGNGGTASATLQIDVNDVDEMVLGNLIEDQKIQVYPNPAKNQVTVDFTLLQNRNVEIGLFDLSGAVIKKEVVEGVNGAIQYPLSLIGLEKGIYIVRLNLGEEQTISFRIVKD